MKEEIWKPIPGYEGNYEISNMGNIRSVDRIVDGFSARGNKPVAIKRKGKAIAQSLNHGYQTACLSKDGAYKTHRVHKLVLLAFVGPRPDEMQVCHNNGIKTDNRVENLRWDSAKENQFDRVIHGTNLRGEGVATAKLTHEQVQKIKAGMKEREAKELFGISKSQFYRIKRGLSWAHV